jgi:pyruvate/2-oxoglutarate/acetoin dehydrogenase E1 component
MSYYLALRNAMYELSKDERTLFVGQGVRWPNNAQFNTLADVPEAQRIELPVIEDFQAGYCLGLAMAGYLPVCIYPRHDFMLLALNQIVSHIDKLPMTSFSGRIIIRCAVGARWPLDSGKQHTNDYTAALRLMCRTIDIIELNCARDVLPAYERALRSERSCMLVERADLYGEVG